MTADQLALFLEAGQQRRKDDLIIQLGITRLAIASIMGGKEGQEAFESFMNDIREHKVIQAKDVSMKDLSRMGIIIK